MVSINPRPTNSSGGMVCWNSTVTNPRTLGGKKGCKNPATHSVWTGMNILHTSRGPRYYCETCAKDVIRKHPEIAVRDERSKKTINEGNKKPANSPPGKYTMLPRSKRRL